MPSEYWHGFGPWYDNVFDLLKQIPFDSSSSIYDKGLSRPIDFGIVADVSSLDGKSPKPGTLFRNECIASISPDLK